MQTCEDFEQLRAPGADGTLAGDEASRFASHLEACHACSTDLAVQRAVREALRASAGALAEPAPAALRARVEAVVRPTRVLSFDAGRKAAPRRLARVWHWMPRSVAAALVVAVAGVVGVGALAPPGSVLALELTLDHLKCRLIAALDPASQPEELARRWQAERGWAIQVPASSAERGLTLLGLRTCLFHEGHLAHVMYDLRGQRVSLFVMPDRASAAAGLSMMGQHTVSWTRGDRTYALVMPAGAAPLTDVAAYVEREAR
jgi:anti-sigma factor RsiW